MDQSEAQAVESSSGSEKGQNKGRKNGSSRGYECRLYRYNFETRDSKFPLTIL